jgi:hypothetical protein
VGEVIKPQPRLSVSAHDLTRETKGLGCHIDRKRYTQCLADQFSPRSLTSGALLIAIAAHLFGVVRCLSNCGSRTLPGDRQPSQKISTSKRVATFLSVT